MDRISNLPDDVLCHILSFLTTKEAALTSVLCKRWRNLIAFVPTLDIHYSFTLYSEDIRQLFMDFVDRVLALQGNSPIKKFSLDCIGVDSDRLDAWIRNVMVRGVSELELSIFWVVKYRYNYCPSPKIFESNKLVKLEICHDVDICWLDGTIFLPMLKTLVLDSVLLSVYNFGPLLHALPVLEELVLRSIRWTEWNVPYLILSSASLKTLTIDSIGCLSYTFDTPSLVNFCYSDYDARDYSVAKMENLLEARIRLRVTEDEIKRARLPNNDWLQDIVVLQFANLGKLMNGIRNVRYMKVCADTLEVVSLCCESMPVFNNLKSLTIENNMRRAWQAWQALPAFLRNSPHIETLILEDLLQHVTHKCGDACDCISREVKGRSLTTCPVKVLKIQECQGTMKELRMIKHFLVYLPCLKEIEIYIKRNGLTQLRVPEVSEAIAEMIELNNKLSSCNVQLLVNGCLYKKWTAQ